MKIDHDIYQIVRMKIKMIDPYYVLETKCKFTTKKNITVLNQFF